MKYFYTCVYTEANGTKWPGAVVDGVPTMVALPGGMRCHLDWDAGRFVVAVPTTRVRVHVRTEKPGRKGKKRGAGRVTMGGPPGLGEAMQCDGGAVGFVVRDSLNRRDGTYDLLVTGGTMKAAGGVLIGLRSGAKVDYASAEIVQADWTPYDCWEEATLAEVQAAYPGVL